jgi:hypothetical protein
MKPIKQFKISFDVDGNQLFYVPWNYGSPGTTPAGVLEEDNKIFNDRLEYKGYSGSYIIFNSTTTGRRYLMFMSNFNELMLAKKLVDNIVEGDFYFIRKGVKPGLRLVLPDPPKVKPGP